MDKLVQQAIKLSEAMEEHIETYGLARLFRVLRNQASNAEKNFQKGNLEKVLSYLVIIDLLCSIGLHHIIEELKK